jgi:hypothetical protein
MYLVKKYNTGIAGERVKKYNTGIAALAGETKLIQKCLVTYIVFNMQCLAYQILYLKKATYFFKSCRI